LLDEEAEEAFVIAGGFELIAKAGEEDVELVLVLVGEDGESRGNQ
jgi:hypothetical protein